MTPIRQHSSISCLVLLVSVVVAAGAFAGVATGVATDDARLGDSGTHPDTAERSSAVTNASLSIAGHTQPGQVGQERVTVSGTSNREDGTTIFVEILGADGTVVTSAEATVNGTSNTWETTIDLTDVEPGPYTVRASDGETSATLDFEVANTLNTPDETPVATATATEFPPTPTPTPTESPTAATADTETDTTGAGTTSTQTPGFGVLVVLGAFALLALAVGRRRT